MKMYRNYILRNGTLYLRSKVVVEKRDEYESYIREMEKNVSLERVNEIKKMLIEDILKYHHHMNHLVSILHSLLQNILDKCNEKLNLPMESLDDYLPKLVYRS